MEELRKLTSDNPQQQSRIETLRALMAAKLAVLQETIELRRTGGAEQAIEVVSTDRGQQIMDQIRVVIQAMKADELSLLDRRNQTRLATARLLTLAMASGVGLLLIVLLAGSRAIDRSTTARTIAEAAEKTQRERQHARSLLEASLDPLVTISPDGQITDVNEATEQVTGVPRDRLIGSDFSDYFTEPDRARAGYRKVLSDGLVRDYPLTIRHVDGHTTDVLYNAVVYRNEAGQVQGVFAAARDVTERKRAEAELARYREHLEELVQQRTGELEAANAHLQRTTAELARSNQELEQFAYVASHDLQEPLRAVTGYLGLIEQQLGDQLDDEARHHIDGAVQGAARMHTLITDLLALSRVGTRRPDLRAGGPQRRARPGPGGPARQHPRKRAPRSHAIRCPRSAWTPARWRNSSRT